MANKFQSGLSRLGREEREQQTRAASAEREPAQSAAIKDAPSEQPRYLAPSRRNKKQITGYFDPAVRKQLAVMAAEEDRTQNELLAEALNMLFERYGKAPIAGG